MVEKKIDLEDLIKFNDGTKIDVSEKVSTTNGAYTVITEEINDFVKKPKRESNNTEFGFFTNVPNTILKESIDKVLRDRNIEEERIRKHMQFEFDRKMQHINRIKSKTYRRMRKREKLRKERALQVENMNDKDVSEYKSEITDSEEINNLIKTKYKSNDQSEITDSEDNNSEEISDEIKNPVIEFYDENKEKINDNICEKNDFIKNNITKEADLGEEEIELSGKDLITKTFTEKTIIGNELEFLKEKEEVVKEEEPYRKEIVMPGWDEWGGEGIEVTKKEDNVIVYEKDGIRRDQRKDYKHDNVIINENVVIPDKYKAVLPYGYNKSEYEMKLKIPISIETNSLRVFKRFINLNKKKDQPHGKNIKPVEFDDCLK